MAAIYLFLEHEKLEEEEGNHFGVKVAIHEYHHVLQQGFLSRQITSTTPSATPLSNRFIVKNYGNVDPIFETKVQAAMDALPASVTLVPVPTLVILIPQRNGGIGEDVLAASVAEVMELQFGVAASCPTMSFAARATANENNAIAEGEAEYYSLNVYTRDAVVDWPKPFESEREWSQRVAQAKKMLGGASAQPADEMDSMWPPKGKESFHVKDGASDTMGMLEEKEKWGGNLAGELTFHYLIDQWRPVTTQEELFQIWIKTACNGWGSAFEEVMGKKWSQFVCDMEVYYEVVASTASCSNYGTYDLGWMDSCTGQIASGTNPTCAANFNGDAVTKCGNGNGGGGGGGNGGGNDVNDNNNGCTKMRGRRMVAVGAAAAALMMC